MSDIQHQVRQFIEDTFILGTKKVAFGPDDSFLDLHLIDSTGFLELIAYLEETFDITVKDDEMVPENLDSLAAIDAYLARKRGA
jgi:acyl carrier protein